MNNLKQFLSRKRIKRQTAVVGIPYDRLLTQDGVSAIFMRLAMKWRTKVQCIDVPHFVAHFSNVLPKEADKVKYPNRIVLFAHPKRPKLNGFAVNMGPGGSERETLLPAWWDKNEDYWLLIAHVSLGSGVLSKPLWKGVFPRWISFERDLYLFLGSRKGEQCWEKVFDQFVGASLNGNTIVEVKHLIEAVYRRALADLYDSYDATEGDILNLTYLQRALDSLVLSPEE